MFKKRILLLGSCFIFSACGNRETTQSPDPSVIEGRVPNEIKTNTKLKAETESFVDQHGMLKVAGSQIIDKNNQPIQLQGMSFFWSQWSSRFWNKELVQTLSNDWGVTVVRAAMGVEQGGYLDNPQGQKDMIKTLVEAAITQGIYVIIDWHDHNAHMHTEQSIAFFSEMASLYGNNPHVIFEIFNEPINISWDTIKRYSERVIGAIREKNANNLVIVGTRSWSQEVNLAADNPIRDTNTAYSLHFYAATHRQWLRDKANYALNRGIALFVTEFGICEASGDGYIDFNESNIWLDFLKRKKISWANWAINDKYEKCSALKPGASSTGNWQDSDLSDSGQYIRNKIREGRQMNLQNLKENK